MIKDIVEDLDNLLDSMYDAGVKEEHLGQLEAITNRIKHIPLVHPALGLKGINFNEIPAAARIEELKDAGFGVTFEGDTMRVTWDDGE